MESWKIIYEDADRMFQLLFIDGNTENEVVNEAFQNDTVMHVVWVESCGRMLYPEEKIAFIKEFINE